MTKREFSDRLNKELSEIGMPERLEERVNVFSKVFKTPKYKSQEILNGNLLPDTRLLQEMAKELEVSTAWLLGKNRSKH